MGKAAQASGSAAHQLPGSKTLAEHREIAATPLRTLNPNHDVELIPNPWSLTKESFQVFPRMTDNFSSSFEQEHSPFDASTSRLHDGTEHDLLGGNEQVTTDFFSAVSNLRRDVSHGGRTSDSPVHASGPEPEHTPTLSFASAQQSEMAASETSALNTSNSSACSLSARMSDIEAEHVDHASVNEPSPDPSPSVRVKLKAVAMGAKFSTAKSKPSKQKAARIKSQAVEAAKAPGKAIEKKRSLTTVSKKSGKGLKVEEERQAKPLAKRKHRKKISKVRNEKDLMKDVALVIPPRASAKGKKSKPSKSTTVAKLPSRAELLALQSPEGQQIFKLPHGKKAAELTDKELEEAERDLIDRFERIGLDVQIQDDVFPTCSMQLMCCASDVGVSGILLTNSAVPQISVVNKKIDIELRGVGRSFTRAGLLKKYKVGEERTLKNHKIQLQEIKSNDKDAKVARGIFGKPVAMHIRVLERKGFAMNDKVVIRLYKDVPEGKVDDEGKQIKVYLLQVNAGGNWVLESETASLLADLFGAAVPILQIATRVSNFVPLCRRLWGVAKRCETPDGELCLLCDQPDYFWS